MKNNIKEEIPRTTHHVVDLMEVLTRYNVQTKNASVWMQMVPRYIEVMLCCPMEDQSVQPHGQVNLNRKPPGIFEYFSFLPL